jgi:oxaloacetate decarboxylase alpha subunit
MPNTPQQMLFRGQNILGYRHYADDVVEKFVERCATNGIDVFRIFDAMNDLRNLETSVKATLKVDKHAQGTLSYTVSPVHDLDYWVNMGKSLEDMGCHSIAIKDMAGLLTPYVAYELVKRLKATVNIPIALHCHATTGLSTTTLIKAAEAGIDMVDTAISSMSMTYGHSSTEAVVSILEGTERDTGLNMKALEEIAAYFRDVRKKYAKFEGSLRGTDSRILVAQVPGGMLTNMESQLKEQGAADRLDEVLEEIPRVRKDLGYLPLVTPTSQIVGTQAVLNVLTGERYKSITKETSGVLKGEYGATPAPVDKELQQRVLEDGQEPITCRPADLLENELQSLTDEFEALAKEKSLRVADEKIDDVLTYALFPQIGMKFLENRDNPSAFEPVPTGEPEVAAPASSGSTEAYTVVVDGHAYNGRVGPGGKVADIQSAPAAVTTAVPAPAAGGAGQAVPAPLAGNIFKINTAAGQMVKSGDVIMVLEAMKMETEVRAPSDGVVQTINVKEGDVVQVGDTLITLG